MFRIRAILRRIRILGSVQRITDPVPALFVNGCQETKYLYFFKVFLFFTFLGIFTSVFKDGKSLRSHKIKVFLNFLLVDGNNRIHIRIRTNNYGSGRSKNLRILRLRLRNTAIENYNAHRFARFCQKLVNGLKLHTPQDSLVRSVFSINDSP